MSGVLTVGQIVAAHARLQPDKIGARDSKRALTFAQWNERSNSLANALLGLGLVKGDRVALLAYNCIEWLELYVALAKAGLIAVPINFRLRPPEIEFIVANCEARAMVVQDALLESIEPVRANLPLIGKEAWVHFGGQRTPRGWRGYEALVRAGSARAPAVDGGAGRHLGADVHLGHHRAAEGRDPQPSGSRADFAGHRARHGADAAGHRAAGDADVPRQLAVLQLHLHLPRRDLRRRRPPQLRPGSAAALDGPAARHLHVAGADALHHDARPAVGR